MKSDGKLLCKSLFTFSCCYRVGHQDKKSIFHVSRCLTGSIGHQKSPFFLASVNGNTRIRDLSIYRACMLMIHLANILEVSASLGLFQ